VDGPGYSVRPPYGRRAQKPRLVWQTVLGSNACRCVVVRGEAKRLVAIDPAWIPLRLALRFHKISRTRAASNLFSYLLRRLRAKGPVASLKAVPFHGVTSAAMVYDAQPIVDHFRKIADNCVMGAMVIEGDDRIYFFELKRVEEV
jgi:hypothetical protein